MVVEQHLPPVGASGESEDHVHRAPGHGPGPGDHAIAVHLGHEGHLAASRGGDLTREVGPDPGMRLRGAPWDAGRAASRSAQAQVFSSFFFAAGKSTLLRISR